jgi:hypothetical protein
MHEQSRYSLVPQPHLTGKGDDPASNKSSRCSHLPNRLSGEAKNLLVKLGELRDAGLVTEEEYNQKKRDILARY